MEHGEASSSHPEVDLADWLCVYTEIRIVHAQLGGIAFFGGGSSAKVGVYKPRRSINM
jgi:hypothetical protein